MSAVKFVGFQILTSILKCLKPQKISKSPFSYAAMPYYFAGLTFGGTPEYVECAENYDYLSPGCQDVVICISRLTSWYDVQTDNLASWCCM